MVAYCAVVFPVLTANNDFVDRNFTKRLTTVIWIPEKLNAREKDRLVFVFWSRNINKWINNFAWLLTVLALVQKQKKKKITQSKKAPVSPHWYGHDLAHLRYWCSLNLKRHLFGETWNKAGHCPGKKRDICDCNVICTYFPLTERRLSWRNPWVWNRRPSVCALCLHSPRFVTSEHHFIAQ